MKKQRNKERNKEHIEKQRKFLSKKMKEKEGQC